MYTLIEYSNQGIIYLDWYMFKVSRFNILRTAYVF